MACRESPRLPPDLYVFFADDSRARLLVSSTGSPAASAHRGVGGPPFSEILTPSAVAACLAMKVRWPAVTGRAPPEDGGL